MQIRQSYIQFFSNFFHMEKMSKPFMGSSVKVNPSMCCLPSHSNYQRSLPGISSFSVSQMQFRSKKTTSCLVLTSDRGLIFGNIIRANLKATTLKQQCNWNIQNFKIDLSKNHLNEDSAGQFLWWMHNAPCVSVTGKVELTGE